MYPAGAPPDKELVETWEWNNFLKAAEKCFKAGHPFGLGLSACTDAINMAGAGFYNYSADLLRTQSKITLQTHATRAARAVFRQLAPSPRARVYAFTNTFAQKAHASRKK